MSKIKLGVGPANASYEGNSPFWDVLKFCIVVDASIVVVKYGWECVNEHFYEKKEKFKRKHTKEKPKLLPEPDPELKLVQDSSASITENDGINCTGRSYDELFSRKQTASTWILDGYMKVGLINFLVAGGGAGKSIVMVQTALSVARGSRPEFLPDSCCASVKLHVVYYRIEDFEGELQGKYGEGDFIRKYDIEWFLPKDLPDTTLSGFLIHLKILSGMISQDTVVFIDPATKLTGYKHTEFVKGVEESMENAKKRGYTLTLVASIHLDEIKDWAPLSTCDIKGGDKGLQLGGSVTALRKERSGEDYRYLQCLKDPKGSPKPFNGDVLVMKKVVEQLNEDNWYLHYQFVSTKPETKARPVKPKADIFNSNVTETTINFKPAPNQKVTSEEIAKMKKMLSEGKNPKKIAKELHISEKTVRRYKNTF